MSDDCRPFIHPATAIKTNRNGIQAAGHSGSNIISTPVAARDLPPNQKVRFSGQYGRESFALEVTLGDGGPSGNRYLEFFLAGSFLLGAFGFGLHAISGQSSRSCGSMCLNWSATEPPVDLYERPRRGEAA